MSTFYFKYKRIVLVDSADLCYAEIPLDEHAILLGGGNVGKSSILNSLRLFLLPEVNFSKCKSKFAFRSRDKDKYYSKDQSFQHYFPSSNSFLILEVENFTGSHCQILYREKGYSYRRIFVPLPYSRIRDLFWSCCDNDDGIGEAVEGLSVNFVLSQLKKRTSDTQVVSDSEKLKQLLYANDFLNDSETRYSLFPLIEHDASKVESLRALFMLLFDINASNKTLSTAIANIIEADKKSSQDVLNFNIDDFLKKHEELEQEDTQLTFIKNKENDFNQLANRFSEYTKLSETGRKYASFLLGLSEKKEKILMEKRVIDDEIAPLGESIKQQDTEFTKKSSELKARIAQEQIKQRDLKKAKSQLADATEIWKQFYASSTIDEATEIVKSGYQDCLNQLETLNSDIKITKRREELEKSIGSLKKNLESLKSSSENQQLLLSNQLSDSVCEVLAAINKKLILANPRKTLKQEELNAVVHFSALFRKSGDEYQWFDKLFEKQSATVDDDLQQQYTSAKKQLKIDEQELIMLEQPSGSFHRQKDITDLETKRNDLKSKFDALKQYPIAKANLETYKQDLEGIQVDKVNLEAEKASIKVKLEKERHKLSELKPIQVELSGQLEEIISIEKTCRRLERDHPRLEKAIKATLESQDTATPSSRSVLEDIENSLRKYDKLRTQIISALKEFIYENIIDDEDHIRVDSPISKSIRKTFRRLHEVFNELPQKRQILEEQITVHNQSVSQYTNVLTKHAEHIDLFRNQLNREFENISINNLEKIEIHIEIDRRFKNLVAEINKADFYSDQLLSDRFYERLKVFVNSFFTDNRDYRLTMDKVVTGLHYRIQKKDSKSWQDKQQSNSTTALINMELAQILLNRIKKAGCDVIFPLVHDEVAEINIDQFDWLLSHLTRKGFRLFSAATFSTSPELIHKIGNYHEIGSMQTARSYSAERRIVYWGDAEQFLYEKDLNKVDVTYSEQSQLFLSDN